MKFGEFLVADSDIGGVSAVRCGGVTFDQNPIYRKAEKEFTGGWFWCGEAEGEFDCVDGEEVVEHLDRSGVTVQHHSAVG